MVSGRFISVKGMVEMRMVLWLVSVWWVIVMVMVISKLVSNMLWMCDRMELCSMKKSFRFEGCLWRIM